ncbi:MAG: hypothetical protein HQK87_07685, partial [Nitrospinae bacterium]|nr:hypothetical protein [Nitrospinota bacterium]
MSDLEQRIATVRRALPYLQQAADRIERSGYIEYLARKSGMDPRAIEGELAGKRPASPPDTGRRPPSPAQPGAVRLSPRQKTERGLLRILMARPELLRSVAADLSADDFLDPTLAAVFAAVARGAENGATQPADLMNYAQSDEIRALCASISSERHLFDNESAEGATEDYLKKLRFDPAAKGAAKAELVAAEQAGDPDRLLRAKERWAALMKERR